MTDRRWVPRQVPSAIWGWSASQESWVSRRVSRPGARPASADPVPDPRQPTRCPTGFGPAPLTEVMYTGRDSVEAWITWPPPMYIATWLTGE